MISVGIPNGSKLNDLFRSFPGIPALYNGPVQTEGDLQERAA
jgi:hypothetical protein